MASYPENVGKGLPADAAKRKIGRDEKLGDLWE